MSEQWIPTTEQVRLGFAESPVDEYYDRGERAFNRWLEQVKREAKIEALREAAERVSQLRDVSCMARDGMTERQAAMDRDYQYFRESPVGWLLDRADQMEEGK